MIYPDVTQTKAENLARCIDGRSEEFISRLRGHPEAIAQASTITDCVRKGYAPLGYGLADFCIIRYGRHFHLFHIPRVPGNNCIHLANEHWFGHAVSEDLNTWNTCSPPFTTQPSNYFESAHIWAPFVFEQDGVFYMYYTGLSGEPSQVLCLATSTDPNLNVWHRYEGNPILPLGGFDWHWKNEQGHLRQGRDPHVLRVNKHFLMAYTTMHTNGCPVVGGLVSNDLKRWEDIGPILYRPMQIGGWMPESVNIQPLPDGQWALIPSVSPGLEYYLSDDPHHWHDIKPVAISYSGGLDDEPMGIEILWRDDKRGEWLVAFFEQSNNRLFFGVLCTRSKWRLTRFENQSQLEPWLRYIADSCR